ncbi:F0F1 ATP synthase subunit A [Jiulongibacter sediminis]|uniref:F0F1 ATP synthase subunit A n=1 Tax=Jiulongibacter sediminis TaxID=1605367 RepID=UPI0026EE5B4D|nr:F0F1 ATP synthase subunit A [Jiulongibacter sediminis]
MLKRLLLFLSLSVFSVGYGLAQEHEAHEEGAAHESHATTEEHGDGHEGEGFNMGSMIMHHILDEHGWEFAHGVKLPLPVILYSKEYGLDIFSSARFDEGNGEYGPYVNHHEKIALKDDHHATVYDFSITKNVASLILSAVLLVLIFTAVAKGYKKNAGKAPKGIQSLLEPVITTIKDEVVKPSIGPKYEAYLPYMLTLFFFILINNLVGLTPGAANLTGNIAVTLTLALITFVIVHFKANKNYWGHIFKPPGVPLWLLPLFWIIEIIGVFMKPASLTIRLFANITGGHIILLSFIGLIFMFKNYAVGGGVWAIGTFMSLIEILVAFIQAYIFTLLSSMYIGSAIEEHHDH